MDALRELSVREQVALLFVVLFGLLALVTIIGVARSLRELTAEQAQPEPAVA